MGVRVAWVNDYPDPVANTFGYHQHNARLREALAQTGVEFSDDAELAVHVCPPHHFQPIPGKRSVLSTNWESTVLPASFASLRAAAMVCPTGRFLLEPLRELLGDGVRLEWLPLGVDGQRFRYLDRMTSGRAPVIRPRSPRPFRFLWVGAPNARKGPVHVIQAWAALTDCPWAELYLKTSLPDDSPAQVGVRRIGNVIYDTRRVPLDELVRIYHSAHCFVFPSAGEGFGLTLAEAMATGLPAIYTPVTAMVDVAPVSERLGWPVDYDMVDREFCQPNPDGETETRVVWKVANPSVDHLAARMVEVLDNWPEAYERGRRAAMWIRSRFTWPQAGARLRAILESLSQSQEQPCGEAQAAVG